MNLENQFFDSLSDELTGFYFAHLRNPSLEVLLEEELTGKQMKLYRIWKEEEASLRTDSVLNSKEVEYLESKMKSLFETLNNTVLDMNRNLKQTMEENTKTTLDKINRLEQRIIAMEEILQSRQTIVAKATNEFDSSEARIYLRSIYENITSADEANGETISTKTIARILNLLQQFSTEETIVRCSCVISTLYLVPSQNFDDVTLDDRGSNAADVLTAGISACQATTSSSFAANIVPYMGSSSNYMSSAMSILGFPLKIYGDYKRNKKFNDALNDMNNRFDQLESLINARFDQIEGFIDRKQFQTDITDPSNILWGQVMAYIQHPGNMTYATIMFQCNNEKAWQIATRIRERLYGPDNTLMVQTKANQYKNSTFMSFKEVLIYRTFQMSLIQSFCIGLQNGPNYNITDDWTWARMYKIYTDVVSNIIEQRQIQERDYFAAVLPNITRTIVVHNQNKYFYGYGQDIRGELSSNYPWDKFGVVIAAKNCWNDQIVVDREFASASGGRPWSLWITTNVLPLDVYVFRYWGDNGYQYSRQANFEYCMREAHHDNLQKWADAIYCGQDIVLLRSSWFCGGSAQFVGYNNENYVTQALYKEGLAAAPYSLSQRPGNITYDLGFWERNIDIKLIPS